MDFLNHYSRSLGFRYAMIPISQQNREWLLTGREQEQLTGIKNEKRRNEWLAGRFAAKLARQTSLKKGSGENISVLNAASGKPYFYEEPDTCLTLSHSGDYVVALVSDTVLGVDLEQIEKRPESFCRFFLTDEEQDSLKGLTDEERSVAVTRYWTRKEAVAKLLGLGGAIPFKRINTVNAKITLPEYSEKAIRLYSGTKEEYMISIAAEVQYG